MEKKLKTTSMKPELKTILIPYGVNGLLLHSSANIEECMRSYKKMQAVAFTSEEFNSFVSDVIKDTLYRATQKVEMIQECGRANQDGCLAVFCHNCSDIINKDLITNTFEEIFNKFKL